MRPPETSSGGVAAHLNFIAIISRPEAGYCAFGAGATVEAAYTDAEKSLGPETVEQDLELICRDDDQLVFDRYMENAGYVFDGTGWREGFSRADPHLQEQAQSIEAQRESVKDV